MVHIIIRTMFISGNRIERKDFSNQVQEIGWSSIAEERPVGSCGRRLLTKLVDDIFISLEKLFFKDGMTPFVFILLEALVKTM